MPEAHLEHQVIKIRQLIEDFRMGRVVIPEFQREYVWKPNRAPKLLDSLYQGFPISSLLLWSSSEEVRPRRRDPRPARSAMMSWLIDGQQRVITLSRTMSGDEGIDVVFDPDKEEFRLANAATRKEQRWFRVAELWEDEAYRQIRRRLPDGPAGERREARLEAVRRILDYEIPLVRMVDHSFDGAVAAFSRINTLGVRLGRSDIESAKVAARHSGFIAEEVTPFLASIRSQGFTRLNIMHLFRACAFVAQPDGRSRTPLHELDRDDVQRAWAQTKRATENAVNLVKSQFQLVNMDLLWSGALLVPVIALCATTKPRELEASSIAGWLAIAALVHRYSSSTESALDQDLRACRATDPIGALLTNVRREDGELRASDEDFAGALVDKGAMFGMYVACQHRGLRDLFTGGKIAMTPSIDRHHILPRAQFPERTRASADCVANIAFVTGAVNRSIGSSGPEVYLERIDENVLRSQCIPTDNSLWRVDRAPAFWAVRRALLAEAFNDYTRSVLPTRRF